MNERIKGLARHADIDFGNFESVTVDIDQLEKFAELIVKECLDIVRDKGTVETNEDYREGFRRAKQFLWQDIKEHFGVEE